jgi:hypothetical protein
MAVDLGQLEARATERSLDLELGRRRFAAIQVPLFYQRQGETGVALAQMRQQQRHYADTAVRIVLRPVRPPRGSMWPPRTPPTTRMSCCHCASASSARHSCNSTR